MTKDLGVWTHENSALVLMDYQKEMFETIRSETSAEVGGRSQSAHRTAIERMALADKAREVIHWYFAEITKLKADIGVSEVEKQAALAGERA